MVNANVKTVKRAFLGVASVLSVFALVIVPGSAAAFDGTSLQAQGGHTLKYVALGDSVAAGLGLPAVPGGTAEDGVCGRSSQAYATTVAAGLNAKLNKFKLQVSQTNAACQGAVVANLTQPQTRGPLTIQPQLDRAFAGKAPALLTLTIGANDVRWAEFVGACFSALACDTQANTDAARALIGTMQSQLASSLDEIRNRSRYFPPVTVVTGYYQPVSLQCVNPNLTVGEVNWLNDMTDDFNSALADTTAEKWFARFAAVDFSGHDICSADSWVQRPGELAPFHPNARGQEAIGKSVLSTLGL